MKLILLTVLFCVSLASNATLKTQADGFSFEGIAYDMKSNAVLYKERHQITLNEKGQYHSAQVTYRDEANAVFATKSLDFSHNLMTPLLSFNDSRVGTSVEVTKKGKGVSVRYVSASDSASDDISRVSMMVVDAGFDQMLLQYWDTLLNNKTLEFEFLAPTRAQLIDFSLKPTAQSESTISFSLAPSNFLLRLVVDPIKLTYDKLTKRILTYEGLTNIEEVKDDKPTGDYYVARIEYRY